MKNDHYCKGCSECRLHPPEDQGDGLETRGLTENDEAVTIVEQMDKYKPTQHGPCPKEGCCPICYFEIQSSSTFECKNTNCSCHKWTEKNKIDELCTELEEILKNCAWNMVARDYGLQLVPTQVPVNWLRVTLSQLRQEIIEECVAALPKGKELPRRLECVDCVHLMKDLDRDDMRCATCNGERGYNQALADVRTEIEKLLKQP